MSATPSGSEFRDDGRLRRPLPAAIVTELVKLDNRKAGLAVVQTLSCIVGLIVVALTMWSFWIVLLVIILIATQQHACFVLAHEAAHYRLFKQRWLNDLVGRGLGAIVGISLCTYRVVHRLHHNHLYEVQDPDIPLHGGYPRGRTYLLKKLGKDLLGFTAYKTYAYFFGAPAINVDQEHKKRLLDDTAPALRLAARRDRWWVVAIQVFMLLAAILSGYIVEYLLLWILPAVTVLQAMLRLRAICEHGALHDHRSPLTAARTNLLSPSTAWLLFPHHVNYHIEHHLYPAIPHYNLPVCHRELQKQGALTEAEVNSIRLTLSKVFADPITS